jgi:hypothetical protein
MKKTISILICISVFGILCAFNIISSGGEIGKTRSPGETSCNDNGCHGGGPAGTTISITATPAFTNNFYDPATIYTMNITVGHPSLTHFGFDCEILTAANANAGLMSNAGSGVQFATFVGKKNATHTTPKAGTGNVTWTFQWTPPASGDATVFVSGNAVNLNGNTSGDFSTFNSLTLTALPTAIKALPKNDISQISLFPNPASDITSISYSILSPQKITIDLTDISGKVIKMFVNENFEPGPHSNILDLKGIAKGVYFVKTSVNGERVSQKLISVQ